MRTALLVSVVLAASGLAAGACATLGTTAGGDHGLPTANMGPFRKLTKIEEPNVSIVLDSPIYQFREPAVLAVDPSDPKSMNVYLYAVATMNSDAGMTDVLVRTRAADGRSFYGTIQDSPHVPPVVLSASLPWEGTNLGGPSVLRVGSEFYLYYAGAGGIGLARSADGLKFTKEVSPVLVPDRTVSWETTTPSAPSVGMLPDGTFDMMYAAGVSIGEATSPDGITFTRVDADEATPELDPVLSPLGGAGSVPDGAVGPIDTGQVGDPCVLPVVDPAGRLVVRVLYTGYNGLPSDTTRSSAIGFAARYGTSGRLERQRLPAFSISMHEAAPTYFAWSRGEMLYVQIDNAPIGATPYVSILAGVAPPTLVLAPAMTKYTSSP